MPKLFYTGTPDKEMVPAASKKPFPPPGALRLPAGGDGRPPKHIQQQQQQQQRKDKMNDDNKTKKKLYDTVERAPPIQNNSSYTTPSSSFLLQPNNDNNESTMILSLLNQETILPNTNNQPKEALLSSLTSWHEFGIFMQGGGGVNNNNKNDDDDNDGMEEEKEEEQLLFHMVSNSIPKKQQQEGDEEQQNNNNNGNDNEVIIIEDNTSEESFHTATFATSTRQRRDNNVAVVAPPIIHTSNVSKQTTTKTNYDEERYSQRTNDVVDARTRNSAAAAAAAVAPPIIHTSTGSKQTTTKTNVDEERSSQQIYGVEEDARRRNPDGIVNPQVQQPKRPLLGYKGMEWDEKNGVWVPTVHGREQVPAQNPAKRTTTNTTTTTTTTTAAESQSSMKVTAGAPNSQFVAQGSTVPPDALPPTNTIALSSKPVESDEVPKPAAVTASEQQQAVVVARAQRAVYESQQSAAAVQDALQKQQQQVQQRQLNQQQQSHRYERPSAAQQVLLGAGASAHESTAPLIEHVLMGASAESTAVIQHLRQQLQQQQLLTTHWFLQQQQLQQQQQQAMSQLRHVVTRTVNNVQTGHGTGGATNNNNRAATPAPAPPIPANPTTNARSGSNNNDKSGGLPDLERWSEYRIDAAKSITELELIRRRLLTLLEKTNSRLKEMRVQRALGNELGVKGAEKLSIKELIDMLSEQVEEESSGNVVGEGLTTTATARKRNHSETEEQSPPRKRQRCCPLCLGTSHLQSETDSSGATQGLTATRNVTCSICEDDGICSKCSSRCLKCFKAICADCFATCSKCNSSSYCSDCVDGGNGKCATCCKSEERAQKRREKRAAEKNRKEPPPPPARAQPIVEPGQTIVPDVEDAGFEFKLPSPPRRKQRGDSLAKLSQQSDSLAKLPYPVPTQITVRPPNEAESKSSETSYAEHRFLISGDIVKIGLNLKHEHGRVTLVDIEKDSLAEKHGVQEGDELALPGVVSVETRKLFIAAASKPRPMIFHVQRSCSKDSTVHRFVVHEQGKLGVKILKVGDTCMISYIYPGTLAEKYGICKNDIVCKPFTNGSEIEGLYDWFLNMAKSNTRPFVIEVFRKKNVAPPPCYSFGDENPFLYRISEESSAVEEADNENGNGASAADQENENAAPAPVYNLLSSASEESRSPPPLE